MRKFFHYQNAFNFADDDEDEDDDVVGIVGVDVDDDGDGVAEDVPRTARAVLRITLPWSKNWIIKNTSDKSQSNTKI